jgi:hypothetical protein
VAPGDYSGKFINTKIDWTVPANDYDLYIHKCPTPASTAAQCNATEPTGQSIAGAPQTSESSSIDPANTGVGDYTIRVVYKFAASDYIEIVVYQDSRGTLSIDRVGNMSPEVAVIFNGT